MRRRHGERAAPGRQAIQRNTSRGDAGINLLARLGIGLPTPQPVIAMTGSGFSVMEMSPIGLISCERRKHGRKHMPDGKEKPRTATRSRARPTKPTQAVQAATQQESDMRRLLREAAWTRMFGKAAGSRNPFAR